MPFSTFFHCDECYFGWKIFWLGVPLIFFFLVLPSSCCHGGYLVREWVSNTKVVPLALGCWTHKRVLMLIHSWRCLRRVFKCSTWGEATLTIRFFLPLLLLKAICMYLYTTRPPLIPSYIAAPSIKIHYYTVKLEFKCNVMNCVYKLFERNNEYP